MRRYAKEDYDKVMALRKQGFNIQRIAKLSKINSSTVYGWICNGRKPFIISEKVSNWLHNGIQSKEIQKKALASRLKSSKWKKSLPSTTIFSTYCKIHK